MGYRVRSPKPLAVLGAIFGLALLVFGTVSMLSSHHANVAFLILWICMGLGIIGFNLWAAFGKSGRLYDIDDAP